MFQLTTQAEYDYIPENKESLIHFIIKIKTAPLKEKIDRKPLNVAIVIDRSGSMAGQKIEYTRKAASHLIERLQEDDRISLVAYDNEVKILSLPVSGSKKDTLKNALRKAQPRGMTNLSAGWLSGLSMVQRGLSKDTIHRVMLMTDGLANQGITDHPGLVAIGQAHLAQGIRTTTLGFGNDFNEDLLTTVADESGGNFYFIDSPEKAPQVFLEELGELASVIGQNLEVVIRCEAGVTIADNLSKFPGTSTDSEQVWRVGDLYANDTRLLIFSLKVPAGFGHDECAVAQVGLRFQSVFEAGEKRAETPIMVTISDKEASKRGPNEEVLREVLTMRMAFAKERATDFADNGQWEEAREALTTGSNSIRSAIAANPSLCQDDISFLSEEADECEKMRDDLMQEDSYDPYARKLMLSQAYQTKKQRGKYRK
jgi:Ca-activated chloride channel homolog